MKMVNSSSSDGFLLKQVVLSVCSSVLITEVTLLLPEVLPVVRGNGNLFPLDIPLFSEHHWKEPLFLLSREPSH